MMLNVRRVGAQEIRRKVRASLFERDVVILAALTLSAKPLGLLNQMIIANSFGTSVGVDAYALGFAVVNLLNLPFALTFASRVTPLVHRLREVADEQQIRKFLNAAVLGAALPASLAAVAVLLAPHFVMRVLGAEWDTEAVDTVVTMMRIMALPGVTAVIGEDRREHPQYARPIQGPRSPHGGEHVRHTSHATGGARERLGYTPCPWGLRYPTRSSC